MKSILSRLLGRLAPTHSVSKIQHPRNEIGDVLRAEAVLKCEEALDLAERAEANVAAYLIECAIIELRRRQD
jgi:hypothetical protein